jgi:hypothetical protein
MVYQAGLNAFLSYFFMRFFLLFPSPSWLQRKAPWIKRIGLAVSVLILCASLFYGFLGTRSFALYNRFDIGLPLIDLFAPLAILAMFLIGMASLILNTASAQSKDERRRLFIVLFGAVAGLVPLVVFIVYVQAFRPTMPHWWLFGLVGATVGIFPLSFIYAVLRHRVLGIRFIVRRGLSYALVSRGFLLVEAAVIFLGFYYGVGPLIFRLVPSADQTMMMLPRLRRRSSWWRCAGSIAGSCRNRPPVLREAYNAQHPDRPDQKCTASGSQTRRACCGQ